jgi:hypothetical protein
MIERCVVISIPPEATDEQYQRTCDAGVSLANMFDLPVHVHRPYEGGATYESRTVSPNQEQLKEVLHHACADGKITTATRNAVLRSFTFRKRSSFYGKGYQEFMDALRLPETHFWQVGQKGMTQLRKAFLT